MLLKYKKAGTSIDDEVAEGLLARAIQNKSDCSAQDVADSYVKCM